MPDFALDDRASLFYRDDDLTEPWNPGEAALMIHGFGENGTAYNAWMPYFAQRYRVIRPDMRGFGRSTPMPEDFAWTLDLIGNDYLKLMDHLGIERFHLVGAKVGGAIALRLTAMHPERVRSLTVMGARFISGQEALGGRSAQVRAQIGSEGFESYARSTMKGRLGSDCPPEKAEGWIKLMAPTPVSTALSFLAKAPRVDLIGDLPRIVCPTLVIVTEGSGVASIEQLRKGQGMIRTSELLVLPGDSFHTAASHPEECAKASLAFIDRHLSVA